MSRGYFHADSTKTSTGYRLNLAEGGGSGLLLQRHRDGAGRIHAVDLGLAFAVYTRPIMGANSARISAMLRSCGRRPIR